MSGSRLGFRGEEDLGGGMKATFVYELGINYSNGTAATDTPEAADNFSGNTAGMANVRQGYLGLSGGFGAIRIGTQNTLTKDTTESMDPNAGASITGAASLYQLGLNNTRADTITYMSPKFGGVQVSLSTDVGESTRSESVAKDNHATAYAVSYAQGPLSVGVSVESRKEALYSSANLVSLSSGSVPNPNGSANKAFDEVTHQAVGASYDFGMAKLFAMTTELKFKDAAAADNGKVESTLVGLSFPAGANLKINGSMSTGSIEDAGTETYDLDGYQLAAVYTLSKRTNAYFAIGQTKLDSPTANSDVKIRQAGLGLRHSF
jgi:predicted porin